MKKVVLVVIIAIRIITVAHHYRKAIPISAFKLHSSMKLESANRNNFSIVVSNSNNSDSNMCKLKDDNDKCIKDSKRIYSVSILYIVAGKGVIRRCCHIHFKNGNVINLGSQKQYTFLSLTFKLLDI